MAEALIDRLRRLGELERADAARTIGGEAVLAERLALYASLGLPIVEDGPRLRWRDTAAPLQVAQIEAAARAAGDGCPIDVRILTESTNADLLAAAAAGERGPRALFAEVQSAGRGRRQRRWLGRYGEALLFSLLVEVGRSPAELPGIALAAGVALAEAIAGLGIDVRVKWPNDLVIGDAKLAGILVETASAATGDVVIGIGLNWHRPSGAVLERAAAALSESLSDGQCDRNTVAARSIATLLQMVREFRDQGLTPFLPRFARRDALAGRLVDVDTGSAVVTGVAAGVAADGALRVIRDGIEQRYYSADVSVRPA